LGTIVDRNEGSKESKIGWFLFVIIIVIVIVSIYSIYIATDIPPHVDDWDHLKLKQEKIEDGWLITITEAHKAWTERNSGFPLSEVSYLLTNNSCGLIEEIDGKFNENGTIIFFDNNNDDLLNESDTFFIYEKSQALVKAGDYFIVTTGSIHESIELK